MDILLSSFIDWLKSNWMILVLIVLAIALIIPTFIRQKKQNAEREELNNSLTKGTKIITTAGVYGEIVSIENTTDGKIVTIKTGNASNPTTMDIHINAIMAIDNKKPVVLDENGTEVKTADNETKVEETEDKVELVKEQVVAKKPRNTKKK